MNNNGKQKRAINKQQLVKQKGKLTDVKQMTPNLPGFYYDRERRRYFRISENQSISTTERRTSTEKII